MCYADDGRCPTGITTKLSSANISECCGNTLSGIFYLSPDGVCMSCPGEFITECISCHLCTKHSDPVPWCVSMI